MCCEGLGSSGGYRGISGQGGAELSITRHTIEFNTKLKKPTSDIMGKDKKAKQVEKKIRVAEKANKKAAQKEKKGKTKGRRPGDESDAEDIDLDAVLEEYARQQAQFLKVTEVVSDPPSPRSSSTLVGSPSNSNELFLFGGELFDGAVAKFYNDLYVYLVDKDEWRVVTSPNTPLPRSGHAWCRGGNDGGIYLFGGEFSSPKQGTFYHYNDFWRLDPGSREWTRIESKGKGPPARSGHRMTYHKNFILLYGGFQDTSQQTKYLSDLWIYDCANYIWHNPTLPPHSQQPDARSSFSFLPNEGGAVIFGGYSRVKATATVGKQTRGGGQAQRTVLKPVVHQDTWFLRVSQPTATTSSGSAPTIRWERRKRPANAPNPPRAGATMAFHRGRGIAFGGVHDVEESEEGIDSEFFNALFAWGTERNRFFQLTLRRPRTLNAKKQQVSDRVAGKRERGKADEDELLRNLAALEAGGSVANAQSISLTKNPEDIEPSAKTVKEKIFEMPHQRFNAQLAVQDDVLYIYGGTFEKGDREFTFDEMWAIDLDKLDGVREIFRHEPGNWVGSEDGDSEDEDEDEDEDDEDEEEDGPDPEPEEKPIFVSKDTPRKARRKGKAPDTPSLTTLSTSEPPEPVEFLEPEPEPEPDPSLPHPRPFEALRDFYARTSAQWLSLLPIGKSSTKELRTEAFRLAEDKWWDCREEIRALEDEQEDAGIGEVVGIGERGGGEGGGAGRRR